MKNELIENETMFENIKHTNENGNEYWEARELMTVLEYSKWENFHRVIKNAMVACEVSNHQVSDQFPEVRKTIPMPEELPTSEKSINELEDKEIKSLKK